MKTILITSGIVIAILIICLTVHSILMALQKKKIKEEIKKLEKEDGLGIIINRYLLWYSSFSGWTIIRYVLLIVPVFTSISAVYFSSDIILNQNQNPKTSMILLIVFSLISAFVPIINSKIQPKLHADGFYKGFTRIEVALIRYTKKLITLPELIDLYETIEPLTNPTVKNPFETEEEE